MRSLDRREWMLGAALGVASCGQRRAAATNSITVLYPGDETVFAPEMDTPAKFLVFLPLFRWSSGGELEGRLAEQWEHSSDFRCRRHFFTPTFTRPSRIHAFAGWMTRRIEAI